MSQPSPYIFDEFFASGLQESISPFLKPDSRKWSQNLSLKISILSAILLALTFTFSFVNLALSHLFLTFVYFFVGVPALINTFEDLKNLEINIDVLMTLAAFLSIIIGSGMEGALLLVLFEFSGAMESTVTYKARGALHNLQKIAPTTALVLDDQGNFYEKSVKEISVGSSLLVKAGEIVPLDGIIKEGSSSLNLVHLTGESVPVPKKEGEEIPAGGRNLESALVIQVTRHSSDSTLARIIQLITQAQEAKPQLQRLLDRFGKPYAITIILLTFAFALLFPFIFSVSFFGIEGSIYRALAFMIAASPCALIIATPTAYLSAISACARKGILLKGGITLDALAKCSIIAFDKTGTLTTGELFCSSIEPIYPKENVPFSTSTALQIAASLEHHVVHPIATAITKKASSEKISRIQISDFHSHPGYGLEGKVQLNEQQYPVAIGLFEYVIDKFPKEIQDALISIQNEKDLKGHMLAFLRIGDSCFLFRLSDTIRENTKYLLDCIRSHGLKPVMLTGDSSRNAQEIAPKVGIEEIFADLRPEDKLQYVAKFAQEQGLAMVGDGINDAPALARSTVGISMGKVGSATAVDASDVVLLNDDLHLLDWLFARAHSTMRIVKQNISLALMVILFATTPALLGFVPLWLAVLLHEGGTVIVGFNSLRLLKK